jgi:hypothetical protein
MSIVDKAVLALKELVEAMPPTERREFAGKISAIASTELAAVGTGTENAGQITSLAATAEEAREKLTPIQAANAFGPNAFGLVRNVMSRAGRMGYVMRENEKVDMAKLDAALAGKDVTERMALKASMARLRLI